MIYEYKCKKCKKVIEKIVNMSERDNYVECPDCKTEMKRILSTFGFIVKGFNAANGYSKGE
jgi:putative FmdB family regulatory protein